MLMSKRKTPRWLAVLTKPIHPIVVRVAVAILLGAATTVAVSWLMAMYVDGVRSTKTSQQRGFQKDIATQIIPTPPLNPQQSGIHLVQVVRIHRWGTDIVEVRPVWDQNPNGQQYGSTHTLVEGTSFETEMKEKFDNNEAPCALWRADGWPLLALSSEARWPSYDAPGLSLVIGGKLIGSRYVKPRDGVRILPLQPIWSGLIINTAFYISLWYTLFSLRNIWRGVRTRFRRRRGQCIHCAYKLITEQTRCSECGEKVS